MHENRQNISGNPWYRGYMPRSYIPPHWIASFGCSMYLMFFGIFFILVGTIITVISTIRAKTDKDFSDNPIFNDPFFKDTRERLKSDSINAINIMRTAGIILISVGAIFVIIAITICCFAKNYVEKYEKNPQNVSVTVNENLTQIAGSYPVGPIPPPESYPQQPAPPPGSYPQYPVPASGSYLQQSVPQNFYPYSPTNQSATSESEIWNTNPPPIGFKA